MDQHHFDQEEFPSHDPHDYEGEGHEYSRSPLSAGPEDRSGFWEKLGLTDRSAVWRLLGAIFVVVALLILGLTVWRFVNSSQKDLIPVIAPPTGPVRERPADPGGLQIMGDDFDGMEEQKGKDVRLAPPPEAPDRHLLEEQHEAVERHRLEEEKRVALEKERRLKAQEEAKAKEEQAVRNRHKEHQKQAEAKASRASKVKAEDHEIEGEFDLDSRISHLAGKHKISAPTGRWQVQFAAYASEADATAKWQEFLAKDAENFQGHHPLITKVPKNGRTYIRLRTGGFSSVAEAKRFCNAVKVSNIPCAPVG